MELRHLRYFVKVASELHFGRAAEALGISQPPLSQQIRLLEEELGVRLFERSSRKVRLTMPGRLFLDEARTTLAHADHAVSVTRRAALGEIGELLIGLSPSTLYVPMVADAISAFHAAHTDVHLVFKELSIDSQRDAVDNTSLDLGFARSRTEPLMPAGVAADRLVTDRMYVAMRHGHRLSSTDAAIDVAELAGEPMVHYPYDREGFLEDLRRLFESTGFRPRLVQETHEMTTLLGLVSAGFGISVLPGSLRRLEVERLCSAGGSTGGNCGVLAGPVALCSMWLLHRGERAGPAARAFIRLLRPEYDSS